MSKGKPTKPATESADPPATRTETLDGGASPSPSSFPDPPPFDTPAPPYPDVDPITDREPAEWPTMLDCIEELESQAKRSHGLYPDTALMQKTAAYLRRVHELPKPVE